MRVYKYAYFVFWKKFNRRKKHKKDYFFLFFSHLFLILYSGQKVEARNKAPRIKSTCGLTHQDVNFPVNLETKVTFDTFLTEHIDVDSLVLAAKPAHFRLPLFHVHFCLLVNKCLLTYTLDYCKVGTDRNPRPPFRIVPTPPYERCFSSTFSFTNICLLLFG